CIPALWLGTPKGAKVHVLHAASDKAMPGRVTVERAKNVNAKSNQGHNIRSAVVKKVAKPSVAGGQIAAKTKPRHFAQDSAAAKATPPHKSGGNVAGQANRNPKPAVKLAAGGIRRKKPVATALAQKKQFTAPQVHVAQADKIKASSVAPVVALRPASVRS